jgi:hypothetical protein
MQFLKDKDATFYLEWTSTAVLIAGVMLTSFNVFPLNLWINLLANVLWLITAALWRKWSLVVVSTILVAILAVGVVNTYLQ